MRSLLTCGSLLLVLAIAACGGGPAAPADAAPTGVPRLAIVSGDSQTAQAPKDTLPADFVVQVTRGGAPVGDQLVDWRVLEDQAGEPFVTTTRTNSDGTVHNRVIAGTRASTSPELGGPAHVQVRWIDQSTGEAIVDTTIAYTVLPAAASAFNDAEWTGSEVPARLVTDEYGNPVPFVAQIDSVASASGETLTFAKPGCAPLLITVADTLVGTGALMAGGSMAHKFVRDTINGGTIAYVWFEPDATQDLAGFVGNYLFANGEWWTTGNINVTGACQLNVIMPGDTLSARVQ